MPKHKHADLIKAWADGATIEGKYIDEDVWHPFKAPCWLDNYEYRIKPEPKPDRVHIQNRVEYHNEGIWLTTKPEERTQRIKWTIDGETGKIKSVELLDK